MIDSAARNQLAGSAQRLAAGEITNWQFEAQCPSSKDPAVRAIYLHGLWPLYDDLVEHTLTGKWDIGPTGQARLARTVLFLHAGLPYRYKQPTGVVAMGVAVLSLATLGWFGRYRRRRLWRGGDESVWPFFARSEYETVLRQTGGVRPTSQRAL